MASFEADDGSLISFSPDDAHAFVRANATAHEAHVSLATGAATCYTVRLPFRQDCRFGEAPLSVIALGVGVAPHAVSVGAGRQFVQWAVGAPSHKTHDIVLGLDAQGDPYGEVVGLCRGNRVLLLHRLSAVFPLLRRLLAGDVSLLDHDSRIVFAGAVLDGNSLHLADGGGPAHVLRSLDVAASFSGQPRARLEDVVNLAFAYEYISDEGIAMSDWSEVPLTLCHLKHAALCAWASERVGARAFGPVQPAMSEHKWSDTVFDAPNVRAVHDARGRFAPPMPLPPPLLPLPNRPALLTAPRATEDRLADGRGYTRPMSAAQGRLTQELFKAPLLHLVTSAGGAIRGSDIIPSLPRTLWPSGFSNLAALAEACGLQVVRGSGSEMVLRLPTSAPPPSRVAAAMPPLLAMEGAGKEAPGLAAFRLRVQRLAGGRAVVTAAEVIAAMPRSTWPEGFPNFESLCLASGLQVSRTSEGQMLLAAPRPDRVQAVSQPVGHAGGSKKAVAQGEPGSAGAFSARLHSLVQAAGGSLVGTHVGVSLPRATWPAGSTGLAQLARAAGLVIQRMPVGGPFSGDILLCLPGVAAPPAAQAPTAAPQAAPPAAGPLVPVRPGGIPRTPCADLAEFTARVVKLVDASGGEMAGAAVAHAFPRAMWPPGYDGFLHLIRATGMLSSPPTQGSDFKVSSRGLAGGVAPAVPSTATSAPAAASAPASAAAPIIPKLVPGMLSVDEFRARVVELLSKSGGSVSGSAVGINIPRRNWPRGADNLRRLLGECGFEIRGKPDADFRVAMGSGHPRVHLVAAEAAGGTTAPAAARTPSSGSTEEGALSLEQFAARFTALIAAKGPLTCAAIGDVLPRRMWPTGYNRLLDLAVDCGLVIVQGEKVPSVALPAGESKPVVRMTRPRAVAATAPAGGEVAKSRPPRGRLSVSEFTARVLHVLEQHNGSVIGAKLGGALHRTSWPEGNHVSFRTLLDACGFETSGSVTSDFVVRPGTAHAGIATGDAAESAAVAKPTAKPTKVFTPPGGVPVLRGRPKGSTAGTLAAAGESLAVSSVEAAAPPDDAVAAPHAPVPAPVPSEEGSDAALNPEDDD